MSRVWSTLACCLALTGIFHGPARASAPTQIAFVGWGGPEERAIINDVIRTYEARNPGVKIKYTQIPGTGYDYYNKVRLMLVAGMAPDVFYVPDGHFSELASRHVLLNLEPYVAKSKVFKPAEIWPSALARYRWDGQQSSKGDLYCLPKDIGPFAMFYNKAVLKARGVAFPSAKTPMTWDEAIAFWKQLTFKEKNVQHFGVSGYQYESAVFSNGGSILSADKRTWALDQPKALEALQWVADLSLVHKVAPDASKTANGSGSASPTQMFESGIAATHFDGRWLVPRYRELPFDWDVAPLPVPKKGMRSIAWSGSVGFGVHSSTKRPDAAFRFVEFLAGPEGQTLMTKAGFQVPNQRWLATTDVYRQPGKRPAHPEVFLDAALSSRPGPWTETPNVFWHDVMWNYLPKVFRGDGRADKLIPAAAPVINQMLREGNPQAK